MEISATIKERSTVLMATLTLVTIGLVLLFSTWQTTFNQQVAEEQHLFFTSRSVLIALESAVQREPIKFGFLSSNTYDLFEALREDGEVVFAGVIDHRGGGVLTSTDNDESISIPTEILSDLYTKGSWSGRIPLLGRSIYVAGKEVFPRGYEFRLLHESPPTPLFLLIGLDTDQYLALHKELRKNAWLQSAYILAAALLCWFLGLLFLSHRKKARRTEVLENFQATLVDNIPDGLLTLDAQHLITSANPAAVNILDFHPADKSSTACLIGQEVSALPKAIAEHIKSYALVDEAPHWQKINYDNMYLEVLTLPLQSDTQYSFLVIIRNRTQMHTLEKNLGEAEKLASIGTLAAGIAHEIRNPLSALRGFAQYFVKKLSGHEPEETYARTMVTEADRLNRVIADLLFLAKPKFIEPTVIDLHLLAAYMKNLLQLELVAKNVTLDIDITTSKLFADEDAIKQCILNLILNSLDALPVKGGKITFSSEKDNSGVRLTVYDNGKGMTKEQQAQAFEPFYTDKERGTGLGLALINQTMTQHGGHASIVSETGKGCAIQLFFPTSNFSSSTGALV